MVAAPSKERSRRRRRNRWSVWAKSRAGYRPMSPITGRALPGTNRVPRQAVASGVGPGCGRPLPLISSARRRLPPRPSPAKRRVRAAAVAVGDSLSRQPRGMQRGVIIVEVPRYCCGVDTDSEQIHELRCPPSIGRKVASRGSRESLEASIVASVHHRGRIPCRICLEPMSGRPTTFRSSFRSWRRRGRGSG